MLSPLNGLSKLSKTTQPNSVTRGAAHPSRGQTSNTSPPMDIKKLTDANLVQEHLSEIKRTTSITDPTDSFFLGALEMTLELLIRDVPQARTWLENRVALRKSMS